MTSTKAVLLCKGSHLMQFGQLFGDSVSSGSLFDAGLGKTLKSAG